MKSIFLILLENYCLLRYASIYILYGLNQYCIPPNNIHKLHVGDKVYEGDRVQDGFFDSISSLKKLDQHVLSQSDSFTSAQKHTGKF